MKGNFLLGMAMLASLYCTAQKAKLDEARNLLATRDYKEGLKSIEAAVVNNETKNSAEAWYLRGMAYLQLAIAETAKAPTAIDESYRSLTKAVTLNPDYDKEINDAIYACAQLMYNKGVENYEKKPAEAYQSFLKVVELQKLNNGLRFAGNKEFSITAREAKVNAAYSALSAKDDNAARTLLKELLPVAEGAGNDAPDLRKPDTSLYQALIEIEGRNPDKTVLLATISQARRYFPTSKWFRDSELNYYIGHGPKEVLLKKLESAIVQEPSNPELYYNLGNAYTAVAFPRDASGNALPAPAEYVMWFGKASDAYRKALNLQPSSATYNYNLAVLYYGEAVLLSSRLTKMDDESPAGQKQYDELLKQRDDQLGKALPWFLNAYQLLDARAANLNDEDKDVYKNSLTGLAEIYSITGNKAKAAEYKSKLK